MGLTNVSKPLKPFFLLDTT